ncbi:MAG TPA: outer membrane homotrimeric porin [Candidatus Desulfovibrio intestinavium]|uniref:Outer membrane homotrimeric porin n=1 Tax=Candidatus Desulfovibrio intestinavium TaxID=2838534 RepID=A0A9D2KS28_9BACT|nr:outer membrane homotrimeric porin [Candidatus Desulfovibrio intestinavium]
MKKLMTLALAAGMLFGAATGASAIDFKAKGQWLFGFGLANTSLTSKENNLKSNDADTFSAVQRIRMQLDAVASESLSGTLYFEIGNQRWGQNSSGAALGADGNGNQGPHSGIKVKRAYLDWLVPQTDLKLRMGIQGVTLPNKAGGSAVLDSDVAGVTASYTFNENVALTALWARPFNDNYQGFGRDKYDHTNYLDNMDLFSLILDLKFDGVQATPWVMYGLAGRNAWNTLGAANDGAPAWTMQPYGRVSVLPNSWNDGSYVYGSMFWAGLPVAITLWDPLNIEFDINYGYVESHARFDSRKWYSGGNWIRQRGNTQRSGWLAKALVEYKMDWGVPGIFGWYASGDDGNVKNGSERMPSIAPYGNFTSFMGDGNLGWWLNDYNTSYAGTWGLGLQIRDMSFIEDLKHTFRVAYWGGTNSPSMAKYMTTSFAWNNNTIEGPYLTTNDGLLEFNLVNTYQIYENLQLNFELGYVVNMIDRDTWKHTAYNNEQFSKQDMWKAQLVFAYSF